MIKFTSNKLIGLGLTSENIKRLKQGQPILIKGSEIGKNENVLICYGDKESDVIKFLQDNNFIDKKTKINTDGINVFYPFKT